MAGEEVFSGAVPLLFRHRKESHPALSFEESY
jgi:hypothetical protein